MAWMKMPTISLPPRQSYAPLNHNLSSTNLEEGGEDAYTGKASSRAYRPLNRKSWLGLAVALVGTLFVLAIFTEPGRAQFNKFRPMGGGLQEYPAEYIGNNTQIGEVLEVVSEDVWSKYAYVQYVTDVDYLCNSLMIFEALSRLGSRAHRLMMYPNWMHPDGEYSKEKELLLKAEEEYDVILRPVQIQHKTTGDKTWADSYTKLLAFNQTDYERVLSLDSDAVILQIIDELFVLPITPVAMPRAYWGKEGQLSSQLLLIQPNKEEFDRVEQAVRTARADEYDMEIMNNMYKDSCMILPHERYDLLTGEFRIDNHTAYFGNPTKEWDTERVLKEAKYLHFSDWPVPKPWMHDPQALEENQPDCQNVHGRQDCTTRERWLGFYSDFLKRRKDICGLDARPINR